MQVSLQCEKPPNVQKPQFFLGFSYVFESSRVSRNQQKTKKNRSLSPSNGPSHEERAKISF